MDVASERDAGFGKALLIEQCECPDGYSGLSCEVIMVGSNFGVHTFKQFKSVRTI